MSPEHQEPSKQDFKELPTPKEGVTMEVFTDLVTDRSAFVRNELKES